MLLCLLVGCWQEIEYRGPDPVNSRQGPPAAASREPIEQTPSDSTEPARFSDSGDSNQAPQADLPADEPPLNEHQDTQPTTTDTQATTISATVEDAPPSQTVSTRRAAWLLGSKLSLAALAHDRGVAADEVPSWFQEARSMAELLKVSLAELPEPPATRGGDASREVLTYLLEQGKQIGGELATSQGLDHAALFEVAMKSNLLLVLNKPGSSAVNHISAAIAKAAPTAELPPALCRPLLDTLAGGSPSEAVRAAVRQLHADVDRHLSAAGEP
jgi:hypothetical protein